MNKSDFTNYIKDEIKTNNYINAELKLGFLKNKIFNHNIKSYLYDNFNKFMNSSYSKSKKVYSQKIYKYYDMFMISTNENSHSCFKFTNPEFKYVNILDNKLSLRFKINNSLMIDPIKFPCLEFYDDIEDQHIESFEIKFKNSKIYVDFLNINESINNIVISFEVHNNNYDNFLKNLSYVLSKLYKQNINL